MLLTLTTGLQSGKLSAFSRAGAHSVVHTYVVMGCKTQAASLLARLSDQHYLMVEKRSPTILASEGLFPGRTLGGNGVFAVYVQDMMGYKRCRTVFVSTPLPIGA